ncbi:MAG: TSUP family transporter [Acidobacteria bacterium]|nr:TSUP family transporter [Acidobacteriota bacterium]
MAGDVPETLLFDGLLLLGIAVGFFVSASAGLGGSLVLAPLLTLALGVKEGIAFAALLLAANNVVKLWAYRTTLPWKAAAVITLGTVLGALAGAHLLVAAPDAVVRVGVFVAVAVALLGEGRVDRAWSAPLAPALAAAAGATSGFSGTSGPLKGIAVRSLGLGRMQTVGAAAIVSATADLTKVAVFGEAGLVGAAHLQLAILCVPLMAVATIAGRRFTWTIGEDGYARLFRLVMVGYALRLLV